METMDFLLGAFVAVVVIVLVATFYGPVIFNGFNREVPIVMMQPTPVTQEYYLAPEQEPKSDLSAVFLPYFAVTNPVPTCSAHAGDWSQTHDRVGCFNMDVPIDTSTTCSSAAYLAALQQCTAVGATGVCEAANVGCYYG